MNDTLDDLLQPSLSPAASGSTLYSFRALFLVGFFGGPMAAAAMGALNIHRLRSYGRDWLLFLLPTALSAGLIWLMLGTPELLPGEDREAALSIMRLMMQGCGIAVACLYWFRHKPYYRAMSTMGRDSPSAWLPGFLSVVAGFGLTLLIVMGLSLLGAMTL